MLKLFNENYYIDLDEIENVVNLEVTYTSGGTSEQQIKYVKYEMIKMMMEVLMTEDEEMDESLGLKGGNGTTIPFKLAFNSLLNKKLINKY